MPCEHGPPNKDKIVLSPLLARIKKPGTNLMINSGRNILVLLLLCFLLLLFRQLAYPDIAKSHGATVVLKTDLPLLFMPAVLWILLLVSRRTPIFDIVLHDNAVMQHGDTGAPD